MDTGYESHHSSRIPVYAHWSGVLVVSFRLSANAACTDLTHYGERPSSFGCGKLQQPKDWSAPNKGDYECALANYNQAIQLKPDWADVYDNRGLAYAAKATISTPWRLGSSYSAFSRTLPTPFSIVDWLITIKKITSTPSPTTTKRSACIPTTTRLSICGASLFR